MQDYMEELFKSVKEKKTSKPQAREETPKAPESKRAQKGGKTQRGSTPKDSTSGPDSLFAKIRTAEAQGSKAEAEKIAAQKEALEKLSESPRMFKGEPSPQESQKQDSPEIRTDAFEQEIKDKEKIEIESYGEVKIFRIPGEPMLFYWTRLISPTSGERALINTIREAATRLITVSPYKIRDQEQRRNVYLQKILEIIKNAPELNVPPAKHTQYAEAVVREMVGYGIIDQIIKDGNLEEIMVNGPRTPIFIFHRKHGMMLTNLEFENDNDLQDLINKIARQIGRRVDLSSPLLDARMPDGSRVNATMPPASVEGSTLTIRKFREEPYSIVDLIINGTLNTEVAAFLWMCSEGLGTRPANILISGGTGSGKTTLLNILASFIPETERVISIEDTAELNLPLKHWIRMEARPPGLEGSGELTMDILTKNSLRMRPDRIIVGEIRHDEAFTLFTALNTGHDGCLTGEAKIALTSGIREIGEFVEEQLGKNNKWKEGEWEVCNVKGECINSVSQDGKMHKSNVVQARRRPYNGEVCHIKLASGSEITCTPNHPLYLLSGDLQQAMAGRIKEGQRIATPRMLLRDGNAKEAETEYWSGLLHGDGNILDKERIRHKGNKCYTCNEGRISLYTEEQSIIPKFIEFMKQRLDDCHVNVVEPRPDKKCFEAHVSGSGRSRAMQELLQIPTGSRQNTKMSNSHFVSGLRSFVAGFFDAEGYVDNENNALVFTCANEYYIDFFRYALLTESISSRKYESRAYNSRWYRLYVYGIDKVKKFYETYPIKFPQKIAKIKELLGRGKKANTNVDLLECNETIALLLEEAKRKGISNSEIARRSGLSQGAISFYKLWKRLPSVSAVKALAKAFGSVGINAKKLSLLADSDIAWDKAVATHTFQYNGFVYDLTTNETSFTGNAPHNFIAQGIVVGNSLGTVHANSAQETIVRVTSPPMNVPPVMLSGLNFIIILHRLHDKRLGTVRRIIEIAEVTGVLQGTTRTVTVYKRDAEDDTLKRTGAPIEYLKLLEEMTGITKNQIAEEILKRSEFLAKLVKDKKTKMKDVSEKVKEYLYKKE